MILKLKLIVIFWKKGLNSKAIVWLLSNVSRMQHIPKTDCFTSSFVMKIIFLL